MGSKEFTYHAKDHGLTDCIQRRYKSSPLRGSNVRSNEESPLHEEGDLGGDIKQKSQAIA